MLLREWQVLPVLLPAVALQPLFQDLANELADQRGILRGSSRQKWIVKDRGHFFTYSAVVLAMWSGGVRMKDGGRSGYEYFEDEDNYLYTIAQFYPRLVVYMDNEGWQNKQFLGSGEFTLNFGDYHVAITVPSYHVVASTGVLQNEKTVLTPTQRKRLQKARKTYDQPVMIVN